jgi:hypothetical protein
MTKRKVTTFVYIGTNELTVTELPGIAGKLVMPPFLDTTIGEPPFIELFHLFAMYHSILQIGVNAVSTLVQFGVMFAGAEVSQDTAREINRILLAVAHMPTLSTRPESNTDNTEPEYTLDSIETLTSFTYALIQTQQLTYKEAADFASLYLENPVGADAWRLRLTRWATERGLPIPEVKRGRPTKKTDGNS